VSNKRGDLFIASSIVPKITEDGIAQGMHHSYILKSKPGAKNYGIGKDVSCAGHIKIKNGKIIDINNTSGHYRPSTDQFIVFLKHLKLKGILSSDFVIHVYTETLNRVEPFSLGMLDYTNIDEILSKYKFGDLKEK
jgi:hypothetical protein